MMRGQGGFTVIEALVAIAFLAITMTGIAAMGVTGITADTKSRNLSVATALARAKLEELRTIRRIDADWAVGNHSETGLFEDGSSGGGQYDRSWTVEEDYNGYRKLWRVTVTVSGPRGHASLASLYR